MADETNEISILEHFSELKDPRQAGKVVYPLDEMLLTTFAAVIGGAEGWVDVSDFGQDKLELLRRYLPYENGVPAHDTFNDLFVKLNPGKFKECFARWVSSAQENELRVFVARVPVLSAFAMVAARHESSVERTRRPGLHAGVEEVGRGFSP